jgi:hypothetical protein
MNPFSQIGRDWGAVMNAADRTRVVLAGGFIFGALSHFWWVWIHGDLWYYGPAPSWAPFFWYGICAVDFVVAWLLLARPRAGIALSFATMVTTLIVNWTQFPTFQFVFNYVLIGLTIFGVIVFVTTPWLWRASRWKLSPKS